MREFVARTISSASRGLYDRAGAIGGLTAESEGALMNRREFIRHAVAGGTAAAVGISLGPSANAAAAKWPIGCINRPWTSWDYDDCLKQIKAARYKTTGLLTRTKTEAFIGADATPEYVASLKQRLAASGLEANMGALRTRHNIPLED